MVKYIIFGNYTEKGLDNIQESPSRLQNARELAKKYDGEISAFYLTLGQYDFFLICKFPNNEKVAQFSLKLSALGNVRTNTLKAFTEDEFKQLLES